MTNDEIATIKRDYDRDGFVFLRGHLQGKALEELRERATRLSSELFERHHGREEIDANGKTKAASPEEQKRGFKNILKNLQHHDSWFEHQLTSGRHVPLIKALVGDELIPATAAWFTKRIGSSEEINPHRDAIGRPEGPQAGATIWIALDPACPENGCLHYGRGSHKIDYTPGIAVHDFDTDSETAVPATVQSGDAVIHNALTVHWSHGNPTNRPRRAVSFFYRGVANQKLFEKHYAQWGRKSKKTGVVEEPQ